MIILQWVGLRVLTPSCSSDCKLSGLDLDLLQQVKLRAELRQECEQHIAEEHAAFLNLHFTGIIRVILEVRSNEMRETSNELLFSKLLNELTIHSSSLQARINELQDFFVVYKELGILPVPLGLRLLELLHGVTHQLVLPSAREVLLLGLQGG